MTLRRRRLSRSTYCAPHTGCNNLDFSSPELEFALPFDAGICRLCADPPVSAGIKCPQHCRFCRPRTWAARTGRKPHFTTACRPNRPFGDCASNRSVRKYEWEGQRISAQGESRRATEQTHLPLGARTDRKSVV